MVFGVSCKDSLFPLGICGVGLKVGLNNLFVISLHSVWIGVLVFLLQIFNRFTKKKRRQTVPTNLKDTFKVKSIALAFLVFLVISFIISIVWLGIDSGNGLQYFFTVNPVNNIVDTVCGVFSLMIVFYFIPKFIVYFINKLKG